MASDKRTGAAGDGGAWARKLAEASARAADAKFGTNLRSHFAANETTYDISTPSCDRLGCSAKTTSSGKFNDKAMQQPNNAVKAVCPHRAA